MGASEKDSSTGLWQPGLLLGWCWGCRPTPKAPVPNPGAGHPCPICNKANVWHEEHPDGDGPAGVFRRELEGVDGRLDALEAVDKGALRCAEPDPRADDCPAYAELKKAVDDIQVSRGKRDAQLDLTLRDLRQAASRQEIFRLEAADLLRDIRESVADLEIWRRETARADDCPAYQELAGDLRDLRAWMLKRSERLAALEARVGVEEAGREVITEMLKKAAAVEPSIEEAMLAADKRLEELDNDVAALDDRLRRLEHRGQPDSRDRVSQLPDLPEGDVAAAILGIDNRVRAIEARLDDEVAELDKTVAGLNDRLAYSDGARGRLVRRLEALESAKPATFEELTDVLVRLEALETRLENVPTHPASAPLMCREIADLDSRVERLEIEDLGEIVRHESRLEALETFLSEQKGEDYRRVVGRIEELEYQLFDIRESLGPAERCQPDPGEPASAGSAADQKLYDDGYLIDVRPPRADAAQRRILRLTRSVERMEPGAELGFGGGWRVSRRGEAMGLRRCWKLNGPGGYSAIHFEAADAVLAWLNRRER